VAQFAHTALGLYYQTEEAMEGRNAFVEKRPVDFQEVPKMTEKVSPRTAPCRQADNPGPAGRDTDCGIIFNDLRNVHHLAGGLPLGGAWFGETSGLHQVRAAELALVAALGAGLRSCASGENAPPIRPAIMVGEDLLRVFQEGKDAAEQVDPPEISLGPAFDPQPDYDSSPPM